MGQGCCSSEASLLPEIPDNMVNIQVDIKENQSMDSFITNSADMVGFSNLTKQIRRKSRRKTFGFKLMVVGESGLGKTTFLSTILTAELPKDREVSTTIKTSHIHERIMHLQENGVKLDLTLVDTPGFASFVDNSATLKPIKEYIMGGYQKALDSEMSLDGFCEEDIRVHACLYFIAPTGHRLKELDIVFMKDLCDKVHIIPVIAKADSFLPEELESFKSKVSPIQKTSMKRNSYLNDHREEQSNSYRYHQ